MPLSIVDEINQGTVGSIIENGSAVGVLKVPSSPAVDLWEWNVSPFPAAGFSVQCTGSGSCSPTLTYVADTFDKSSCTPFEHWPSENKVFKLVMNTTVVGWVEVQDGSTPDMMWWSNGSGLNGNRELVMGVGDELFFEKDSLPGDDLYPLQSVQTPV